MMRRPKSAEEFVNLVEEAIFELEEAIACAEEEGDGVDEFSREVNHFQQLLVDYRALAREFANDEIAVGRGKDLPFMGLVNRIRARIPFIDLLALINEGYKHGFD